MQDLKRDSTMSVLQVQERKVRFYYIQTYIIKNNERTSTIAYIRPVSSSLSVYLEPGL